MEARGSLTAELPTDSARFAVNAWSLHYRYYLTVDHLPKDVAVDENSELPTYTDYFRMVGLQLGSTIALFDCSFGSRGERVIHLLNSRWQRYAILDNYIHERK